MGKQEVFYDRDDRKISQEQFEDISDNIYEAIMVLGHRMREIERNNAEQFQEIKEEMMDERAEKEYSREYFAEVIEDDLPVFPKSIRVSMHEMLNDELEYNYEDVTKIDS